MRDKMFRGKRKDTGDWVYSRSIIEQTTEYGEKEIFIPKGGESSLCTIDENDNLICIENCVFYKVIPETVGQYTGKEINGEKLFDGDIVETYEDYDDKFGYSTTSVFRSVVIWDEENLCCAFKTDDYIQAFNDWSWYNSRKIGNIHDNPELLKGVKK